MAGPVIARLRYAGAIAADIGVAAAHSTSTGTGTGTGTPRMPGGITGGVLAEPIWLARTDGAGCATAGVPLSPARWRESRSAARGSVTGRTCRR